MATNPLSHGDHFFDADGVRFHYLVRGTGSLVIVHSVGWGVPGNYLWDGMGPHLEKNNTVLYFEPRGNGESSRPADTSTMSAKTMAEDIEYLRAHLGLDILPLLVGNSHAGAIALRYAETRPSRVAKLVLLSTQIMDSPPNTHTRDWIIKRKDDPAYATAVAKLSTLLSSGGPKTDEEFQADMDILYPWYFSDVTKAEILRSAKGSAVPKAFAFQTNLNDGKAENKLPHVADAGKVTAKTLIIRGGEDAMCSPGGSRALAEGIQDSKLVTIPGVGHFPWIEKPDEFWEEVDLFLKT
ncbi:Alpha/Beta hydrolase protein [Dactylonectria estremocensis]|uniref:Alpha/Beta hydrolase protein n=1 Tax=Dactylonectria estremocensis TaxID=1079267 RepID=A0A9P9E491_9HYPO|nr:Alpha/Beta hydrolase protein [Dactylonectria estremocensis]